MPDDLFGTVTTRRKRGRRLGGLPLSIAFHAAALTAAITVPLVAGSITLPEPHAPLLLELNVIPAIPVPEPPGRRAPRAPIPLQRPAPSVPLDAPASIAPENGLVPTPYAPAAPAPVTTTVVGDPPPGLVEAEPVVQPPAARPPVPIGGDVKPPRKIVYVPPVYPHTAIVARVDGIVTIEAVIGVDGKVRDARVVGSVALLDQAALDAVRQWVFTPTLLNGVPVPVIMSVKVEFSLR